MNSDPPEERQRSKTNIRLKKCYVKVNIIAGQSDKNKGKSSLLKITDFNRNPWISSSFVHTYAKFYTPLCTLYAHKQIRRFFFTAKIFLDGNWKTYRLVFLGVTYLPTFKSVCVISLFNTHKLCYAASFMLVKICLN